MARQRSRPPDVELLQQPENDDQGGAVEAGAVTVDPRPDEAWAGSGSWA